MHMPWLLSHLSPKTVGVILCIGLLAVLTGCRQAKEEPSAPSSSARSDDSSSAAPEGEKAPPQAPETTDVSVRTEPSFEITNPADGAVLEAGKRIQVSGTCDLAPESHVWLFLVDIFGGYYLQNPPVEILPQGKWEQGNVIPGKGIKRIIAVAVDADGHERVKGWVGVSRWGRIPPEEVKSLPGFKLLAGVSIKTPDPD